MAGVSELLGGSLLGIGWPLCGLQEFTCQFMYEFGIGSREPHLIS